MPHTIPLLEDRNKNIQETEVLTNLDFLNEGAKWPPPTQRPRLDRYTLNKTKFDNKTNINKKAFDYMLRLIDDRFSVISYRILVNFYRKVSYKTADLLFVERPKYITKKEKQDTLDEIVDLSELGNVGYQGAIDVSRYGDAIYIIKIPQDDSEDGQEPDQGKGRMTISNPRFWYPVVSENDLKEIQFHVLAHVVTREITEINNEKKEQKFLKYQVHKVGSFEVGERIIEDDGTLGAETPVPEGEKTEFATGLSGFAVVPTHNVVTSDSVFGIDDYIDIINLIDELQTRLEQIAHVLDKHSDPTMSGPSSALEQNQETGEYSVKLGGYLPRDSKEDPDAKYLTWDGKLDASFKEIELILDLLVIITEMGAAIFDRDKAGGGDLSGRALKLLYVNPLTKVARIRNNFDDAFKQGISLSSEVGYGESQQMTRKEVNIEWLDGLPNDPKELAEIGQVRVTGPTDTLVAQIMKQDGLTIEQAEAKAALIAVEEAASIPAIGTGIPFLTEPEA